MKTSTKISLIIALVLLGAGAVFLVAGCSLASTGQIFDAIDRATDGKASKENVEKMIDNIVGQVEKISDEKLYDIDDFGSMYDSEREILKGDIELLCIGCEGADRIKIVAGGCDFEIKDSEDDDFWVEAKGVDKLQAYVEGKIFHVITTEEGKVNLTSGNKTKVTLYLPSDFEYEQADIDLAAGELTFKELEAKELCLKVGAGEIKAKEVKCGNLIANVGAGNLELEKTTAGDVELKAGAGNIMFDGTIEGDCVANCGLGNISMDLKNKIKDFNIHVECSVGNVKVDGEEYSGLAQVKNINYGASHDMTLKCSVGNIEVDF